MTRHPLLWSALTLWSTVQLNAQLTALGGDGYREDYERPYPLFSVHSHWQGGTPQATRGEWQWGV